MKLKENELRIGNFLNYTTAEGDVLPTTIDWQDLKWISEDPEGFNLAHSAIPLTEECLLKFGFFKVNDMTWYDSEPTIYNIPSLRLDNFKPNETNSMFMEGKYGINVKYVNQLQNLYQTITGRELNEINNIEVIDPETVKPE